MRGKIYRFIFVEGLFKPQAFFCFLFPVVLILEISTVVYLDLEMQKHQRQRSFAMRISEMENILSPGRSGPQTLSAARIAAPIEINGKLYVLKGIQKQQERPYALINDQIYQEGEAIMDYKITRITTDAVLLQSALTKDIKILRFGF